MGKVDVWGWGALKVSPSHLPTWTLLLQSPAETPPLWVAPRPQPSQPLLTSSPLCVSETHEDAMSVRHDVTWPSSFSLADDLRDKVWLHPGSIFEKRNNKNQNNFDEFYSA